jgi:hypothetical protein
VTSSESTRDAALAFLSVVIGMIMEDHADEAVSMLPPDEAEREQRFERLRSAGADIVCLAGAAQVLLRRTSSNV